MAEQNPTSPSSAPGAAGPVVARDENDSPRPSLAERSDSSLPPHLRESITNVPVTPGIHQLVIIAHVRNGQSYIEDPWEFTFRFEKGHTYEFSDNDDYGSHLKVMDRTTNQMMLING